MTLRNTSLKSQTFRYDFNVDTGAVGSYLSPFAIPGGCYTLFILVKIITTVTGGVGSGISWGKGSGAGIANYIALTPIAGMNANTVLSTISTSSGAIIAAGGEFLSMTIDTDPLTDGVIDTTVFYLQY